MKNNIDNDIDNIYAVNPRRNRINTIIKIKTMEI